MAVDCCVAVAAEEEDGEISDVVVVVKGEGVVAGKESKAVWLTTGWLPVLLALLMVERVVALWKIKKNDDQCI